MGFHGSRRIEFPIKRYGLRGGFSVLIVVAISTVLWSQDAVVEGTVTVLHHSTSETGNGDVVVSLTPLHPGGVSPGRLVRLAQKNKKFIPHVVAVTPGTEIEFPNQDLFFHSVFSIHQGKTFDLGLYESGAARKVKFTQPGISYIFCNIHPEMSAVVLVLRTGYFTLTGQEGSFQIDRVPPGRYKLEVWYEQASEAELAAQGQEVEVVSGANTLARITLHSSDAPQEHLNKHGEPYYAGKAKGQ